MDKQFNITGSGLEKRNISLSTPLNSNTTQMSHQPNTTVGIQPVSEDFISAETSENIRWILALVVIPCVSLPGIIGNISSLLILYRHGFMKTSNILLAALALADAFYLLGVNNIPLYIHEYSDGKGYHFPVSVCYIIYALYRLYTLLEIWGQWCSLTIPVLITIERLVAVYYPFRFPIIVTPRKTWLAVTLVYILWLPMNLYYFFLEDLVFVDRHGETVGLIVPTFMYTNEFYYRIYISVKTAAIVLSEPIPVVLVITGCIMVGIRVRIAHRKRQKMMSAVVACAVKKTRPGPIPAFRTTWTLMSVCLVYTITVGLVFVIQVMAVDSRTPFGIVLETLARFIMCVHSSCNFFIYIYVNRNFRETYRSVFGSWGKERRRTPPRVR